MTIRLPCTNGMARCACGWRTTCRGAEVHHVCKQAAGMGLGDMVAAGLSAVGITPERVSKAVGKPCGCGRRKSALNRLGAKLGLPPGSG